MKKYLWLLGFGIASFSLTYSHLTSPPDSNLITRQLIAPALSEEQSGQSQSNATIPDWVKQSPVSQYVSHQDNEQFYRKYQITPEWMVIRALLRAIGRMEGTYNPAKPEQNPYQIIFGFRKFTDYSKHPDLCIRIGAWGEWAGQCSTAAGMSQWITSTWDRTRTRWKDAYWFSDGQFSPRNQDLGTLRLMIDRGIYNQMIAGIRVNKAGDAPTVTFDEPTYKSLVDRRLSRVWASFPCFTGMKYRPSLGPCDGTSFYGQGGKPYSTAWKYFQEELAKENQGEWLKQLKLEH